MTPFFDRRAQLPQGPRLHALVIGVSDYTYLPADGIAAETLGLRKLTTAARSALRVHRWLVDHADALTAPLATVFLCVSPTAGEAGEVAAGTPRASRAIVQQAYFAWRDVMRAGDLALFYFAGHGLRRTRRDAMLLLDDVFAPGGPIFANAIEVDNVVGAMQIAPPRTVATRQLFFVDACGDMPRQLDAFEDVRAPDLDTVLRTSAAPPDTRDVAVYYAAMPGQRAYADEQSLFSRALLCALDGGAAAPADQEDDQGHVPWRVTTSSLYEALRDSFALLAGRAPGGDCSVLYDPRRNDIELRTFATPPDVDVIVRISPDDALPVTRVAIADVDGNSLPPVGPPVKPHPWKGSLRAGLYKVSAEVGGANGYHDARGEMRLVRPPRTTFARRVR